MAVLFLSHSSLDDGHATTLETWLKTHNFTDMFVDHQTIAGGDKWREALRTSAGACRVVVCLVTGNWLASSECFNEFRAAWYMGKRIIPLFLLGNEPGLDAQAKQRFAEVVVEDQGIDLLPCLNATGALHLDADPSVANRLKAGLRAAGALSSVGLDPEAFEINRGLRPTPFPGLAAFGDDDADAAIFYGRSREIAHVLEDLRSMRALRDMRPLFIQGASGAGKSSLLRAGVIPRLRREAPAWLPLRAFRPGADPLLNFAEALSRTFADFGRNEAHGTIRDRLLDAWTKGGRSANHDLTDAGLKFLQSALESEGASLRNASGRPGATILISVDQAEEIARADGQSGEALADYLRAALTATAGQWQLAFTIRTDSLPELQSHRRFQNLEARGYDLRAVPVFRFDNVVVEPAKRYGVRIDDVLVDALMEDAPKEDALPLLAFGLQRLWRQYAASGALSKENYDKVGGLKGLIEDAAERALRGLEPEQDVPLPAGAPLKRQVDLTASTFVPALAQISDQGATIRRVASWASFNDDQRHLLARFDRWRLVVHKGTDTNGGTVEVTHEALFREWTRLKGWLEPERARLEALRLLQLAASTWSRKNKAPAFLDHRDKRLAEAIALRTDAAYAARLTPPEVEYIAACQRARAIESRKKHRNQALVGVLAVSMIAGGVGWLNQAYLSEQLTWHTIERPYMTANVLPFVLTPAAEQALKAKDSFRECAKTCPEMVVVPAGEFVMGSPVTEAGRNVFEVSHKVTIGAPFAAGKFAVTFAEWDACAANGGCKGYHPDDHGWGRDTRPAIKVSWDDAQQYVAWLSKMSGKQYRLLTEAEWEYAARAGSATAFPWGNEIGAGNANCRDCGSSWGGKETAPVGSFPANAFGLHDMHGNVFQWVQDAFNTYDKTPTDGTAVTQGEIGRVVRGGNWLAPPQTLRSARRGRNAEDSRLNYIGFRVGRTLNQ